MKVKYDMMLVRRMKMYKNGVCEKEIEILRKNNGKQKMLDRVNEKLKAVVISIRGVKKMKRETCRRQQREKGEATERTIKGERLQE